MQKRSPLFLLFFFALTQVFAQGTPAYELLGSFIDLKGQLIHEHNDQDYAASKSIHVSLNSMEEAAAGVYYPPNGVAGKGHILYQPGDAFFTFQREPYLGKEIIEPPLGWSFTVGADSFVVANGFPFYDEFGVKEKNVEDPHILQYLGKTKQFSFFKFIHTKRIQGHLRSPNFLVRKTGEQELNTLPVESNSFIATSAFLFQDYPELNELLQNKEIEAHEIDKIIWFIQYADALKSKSLLYYKSNWSLSTEAKTCSYYAKVAHEENKWMLDYFNRQGQKIFTEYYAYKDPLQKVGEIICYDPGTAQVRKKIYLGKEPKEQRTQIFHPNERLHYVLTVSPSGQPFFEQVYTAEGKHVLNAKGYGSESFYDHNMQRTIHREYSRHLLAASWYVDDQDRKIYQYAAKNASLRSLKALAKKARYPEPDVLAGNDGVVLVKIMVTPDDQVESYTILKGISPSIDQQVHELMAGLRIKSGKQGKEKVYQEIIMPVQFSLLRQSSDRYNFYHYHNPFLFQQMHMHNMHQMQQMNQVRFKP